MAQLHRHPRWSRHRTAEFWRLRGPHFGGPVHARGDGDDGLRACDLPLACEEYSYAGARGIR